MDSEVVDGGDVAREDVPRVLAGERGDGGLRDRVLDGVAAGRGLRFATLRVECQSDRADERQLGDSDEAEVDLGAGGRADRDAIAREVDVVLFCDCDEVA